MAEPSQLGAYLTQRRASVSPEHYDIPVHPGRRVAGLRREELAHLTGVSVAYYTRLEQGTSVNASEQVLSALARVLLLDADETAHLFNLSRSATKPRNRRPHREQASASMRELIAAMPEVPALVLGRRNDVLAWNPLGHRLIASHLDVGSPETPAQRPSTTRMLFLDPHARAQEADWEHYAKTHVAYLRMVSGRYPDDALLTELIGELTINSPEFARFWASGNVRECTEGQRALEHPEVGRIELTYQVLTQPRTPDLRIEFYTTEAGSPSRDALALLASTLTEPESRPARHEPA
ncbi:helix-turn-helix transcriptional regulator [Leucobacter sp. M11]|uniref:helix-turn-helix transcriptional regulator n=1 Tax=Leucobacter sp. M11 TaxID=2993565 RepID=UPI002D7F1CA8|nr:helix-turn-helix transcriptional regulator [Leucobacter sp. M11]MEB4616350.1 helix-turn-helix transcriptional regulator [Leucobacter sp. M11]